jgi:putative hydrolase of the HAD superfamily
VEGACEIEAIFLDAGNTLIHTPVPRADRLRECLSRRGHAVDPRDAGRAAERAAHEVLSDGERWVETPEDEAAFWAEYWPRILALLGLDDPDGQLARHLDAEVKYVGFLRPYSDVRRALVALRGRYRLGLISNAFPSLVDVMDDLGLTRFFDSVVTSAWARVAKPDPLIYQKALDTLGVEARASAFVDDLPANLETAEQMGFQVYLMDRDDRYPDSDYLRLKDMMELVERLTAHQRDCGSTAP